MKGSAAGGNVGLMGEIARTVAAGLGSESVIGVIPSHLQSREVNFSLASNVHTTQEGRRQNAPGSDERTNSFRISAHPSLCLLHIYKGNFPGA